MKNQGVPRLACRLPDTDIGKGAPTSSRLRSSSAQGTAIIAALGLILTFGSLHAYERLQGPTEVLYWNKTNTYNGYTFFGVGGTTYLLDMEGRVVHTWPIGTNPHLLTNGNVLDASKDDPSGFGGFTEVDWSGNIVWQYTETRTNYAPHHDFVRIFNPKLNAFTTLVCFLARC